MLLFFTSIKSPINGIINIGSLNQRCFNPLSIFWEYITDNNVRMNGIVMKAYKHQLCLLKLRLIFLKRIPKTKTDIAKPNNILDKAIEK